MSVEDTISFIIDKSYIGSNVDSINVMIDMAEDTSDLFVYPNMCWALRGKALGGDGCFNESCMMHSTCTVHVRVYIIINPLINIVKPQYTDKIGRKQLSISDSIRAIIQAIPVPK